jgi:hypothetical protein
MDDLGAPRAHVYLGLVSGDVSLEVEVAAIPRGTVERGPQCRFQVFIASLGKIEIAVSSPSMPGVITASNIGPIAVLSSWWVIFSFPFLVLVNLWSTGFDPPTSSHIFLGPVEAFRGDFWGFHRDASTSTEKA